jgi:RNA polymerase sigma factor for flagellar operon FliA
MSPTRRELRELVRWAKRIAWMLGSRDGQLHDYSALVGAALRGLHDALAGHDPTRGVPFKVYARPRIRGEVRDALEAEKQRGSWEVPLNDALDDRPDGEPDGENEMYEAVSAFVVSRYAQEIGADGEAGLVRMEAYAVLHAALGPLAPEARRLLRLRYWEDRAWKDVGAALGLSEQEAKDYDRKLRAHLKAVLSPS